MAATRCKRCASALSGNYFLRGTEEILCGECRDQLLAPPRLSGFNAFLRASLAASAVAVIASVLSAAVTYATDMTFALVWIFVSMGIGIAIKKTSEDRGTWPFRLLGMFATYCAIGLSYALLFAFISLSGGAKAKSLAGPMSDFIPTKQILQSSPTPASSPLVATPSQSPTPGEKPLQSTEIKTPGPGEESALVGGLKGHPIIAAMIGLVLLLLAAIAFVLAMPVLMMLSSPMEIVIDGIALYYAWKSTAPESKLIEGPFSLGDAPLP